MSLLGKILALLNLFGVIALFALGFIAYSKRQAWAYSVLRHELAVTGLPVDNKEPGAESDPNRPLVEQISDETARDLFASHGGDPQKTQVDEVVRVRTQWTDKLSPLNDRQALLALARALLPLADTYPEREEYLAGRNYFLSDATAKAFDGRYRASWAEAIARASEDGKLRRVLTFDEGFRVAMRTLGGEPSEGFTNTFLSVAPIDLAKLKAAGAFEAAWTAALKSQRETWTGRLQERFARAQLDGPRIDSPAATLVGLTEQQRLARGTEAQKRAIARLLFSLCRATAEEAADGDAALSKLNRGSAAYASALVNSSAYKQALGRVYVVCGLQLSLAAIADDAATIRKLAQSAESGRDSDLAAFVLDHGLMVEELRDRAALLRVELGRIQDNTLKRDAQVDLVKERTRDVKQLRDDLTEARNATQDVVNDLEATSSNLFQARTKVRDAIEETKELERQIRNLESTIRAHERSATKKGS